MDTKYCNRCEQDKPLSEYTKNKAKKDGLQGYCRDCAKTYRKEHYHKNKEPYLERAKRNNLIYKLKTTRWIHKYKAENNCKRCGISYPKEPWLLEFDHIDRETKINTISAIRSWSLENIKREIEKCDLLCIVCHRRRTAEQFNWKYAE